MIRAHPLGVWEVVFWDEPSLQAVLPGAGALIPPSAHQVLVTGFAGSKPAEHNSRKQKEADEALPPASLTSQISLWEGRGLWLV